MELVKWIVIFIVVISVFNLVTGKTPYNEGSTSTNIQGKTYTATIIVGNQPATTYRNW